MTTTAETVAKNFHDDGGCFVVDGRSLDSECRACGGMKIVDSSTSDVYSWRFSDGSCITVAGGGWDIGFEGCYCWRGDGHADGCTNSEET